MIKRLVLNSILNKGASMALDSSLIIVRKVAVFLLLILSLLLVGFERVMQLISPIRFSSNYNVQIDSTQSYSSGI